MFRPGTALLLALNRLPPPLHTDFIQAKTDPFEFAHWEYARAADIVRAFTPEIHLKNQHVLDLGTGFGGKLVYYQQLEPASITTVDIRPDFSAVAQAFVAQKGEQVPIHFVTADAAALPFADHTFDMVISNETFEHIQAPLPALQELARVTRPHGRVFISFPPYYAPWGAHLNNWITLPWVQVIFSERTLIEAANRLEEELQLNRRLAPEARLDLRGCATLPHINRITLQRFESLLRQVPLQVVRKTYLGPGWRRRPKWHALAQPFTHLPLIREMFTSHAVYVLQRPA